MRTPFVLLALATLASAPLSQAAGFTIWNCHLDTKNPELVTDLTVMSDLQHAGTVNGHLEVGNSERIYPEDLTAAVLPDRLMKKNRPETYHLTNSEGSVLNLTIFTSRPLKVGRYRARLVGELSTHQKLNDPLICSQRR